MKLSKDEKVLYKLKPRQRLIVLWFFTRCFVHGLATAFFVGFSWWFYETFTNLKEGVIIEDPNYFILTGFLLFIFGSTLSYVYQRFLVTTIQYYITDRRCVWKGGIVRKVEHTVSYHKITDVERSQNLIEQVLKISTINLFTPGTASMRVGASARSQPVPELRFEGLQHSDDEAEAINEQIREFGHAQP